MVGYIAGKTSLDVYYQLGVLNVDIFCFTEKLIPNKICLYFHFLDHLPGKAGGDLGVLAECDTDPAAL